MSTTKENNKTTTIPYVSPDGGSTRYYADRFYLDAPTGLLEYQLAQKEREAKLLCSGNGSGTTRRCSRSASKNHDSSQPQVKYCNGCGERILTTTPENNDNSTTMEEATDTDDDINNPLTERILFDRAKFINSLDLSAAIIGTFSVGDFDFLSSEFPMLFPPPSRNGKNNNSAGSDVGGRRKRKRRRGSSTYKHTNCQKDDRHVPTLVLHGQRGFNLNSWAKKGRWQRKGATNNKKKSHTNAASATNNVNSNRRMEQESQDSLPPDDILDDILFPGQGRRLNESDDDASLHQMDNIKRLSLRKNTNAAVYSDDDDESSDDDEPLDIRGGGNSQQQSDSQDVVNKIWYETPPFMKDETNHDKAEVKAADDDDEEEVVPKKRRKSSRIADKVVIRPCFTYNNQKFKLPRTPNTARRRRRSSSSKGIRKEMVAKQQHQHAQVESVAFSTAVESFDDTEAKKARSDNNLSKEKEAVGKEVEIITINSDSSQGTINEKPMARVPHTAQKISKKKKKKASFEHTVFAGNDQATSMNSWDGKAKAVNAFGGQVFFTQILPAWCKPLLPKEMGKERRAAAATAAWRGEMEDTFEDEKEEDATTVRGCHHPKFFLLFEKCGSLVVIISTSNLTPSTSIEGSWVQRFEPAPTKPPHDANSGISVDKGMSSDFGVVLADFLMKQSEAADTANDNYSARAISGQNRSGAFVKVTKISDDTISNNEEDIDWRQPSAKFPGSNADEVNAFFHGEEKTATFTHFKDYNHAKSWRKKYFSRKKYVGNVLPDSFLRRFVPGLDKTGLAGLAEQYQFDKAQVHLVSTVPGDYMGSLGDNGTRMNYGPQRVESILSRIHNENGTAWIPQSLNDRLIIQPTSFGIGWTSTYLETIINSYLHHKNAADTVDGQSLELTDIVWPSLELFDEVERQRRIIWNEPPMEGETIADRWANKNKENGMVFLSSDTFSRLEQSVISRMAQLEQTPNTMPYKSACCHFKSVCRLLRLNKNKVDNGTGQSKEYLSWFMLTSSCLSRGAQGQPTPMLPWAKIAGALPPPKGPREECNKRTYANFELGVLFSSRITGDSLNDRLYVSDSSHVYGCQCGKGGKRGHSNTLTSRRIKKSVRKVHLPVPYELRPRPYQEDPKLNMMSCTPYMHSISNGCTKNMMQTPLGQQMMMDSLR